jgi:hypothetical protein
LKRIDIVKDGDEWKGKTGGRTVPNTKAPNKDDAVKNTAKVAKGSAEPVTVKIHNQDGRIQEERTYPSKADPHSSKG